MWPVHGHKWCEDNSVGPFLAVPVLYYFWRLFGKKYSFPLKKRSFLYIICTSSCWYLVKYVKIVGYLIAVCLTWSVRFSQHLRSSTYSVTIIRSVIVNTVESAKTWCQNNSDFTVFLNRRLTIFRRLNIYNLLSSRQWYTFRDFARIQDLYWMICLTRRSSTKSLVPSQFSAPFPFSPFNPSWYIALLYNSYNSIILDTNYLQITQ